MGPGYVLVKNFTWQLCDLVKYKICPYITTMQRDVYMAIKLINRVENDVKTPYNAMQYNKYYTTWILTYIPF